MQTGQAAEAGGAWHDHQTSYYRYYKSGEAGGFEHGLKYSLGPTAFARLASNPNVPDPLTASDAIVALYAGSYYEKEFVTRPDV